MIDLISVTNKFQTHETYHVVLVEEDISLGLIQGDKGKLIYYPNSQADSKGNFHLIEIAELVEDLNRGEGISDGEQDER